MSPTSEESSLNIWNVLAKLLEDLSDLKQSLCCQSFADSDQEALEESYSKADSSLSGKYEFIYEKDILDGEDFTAKGLEFEDSCDKSGVNSTSLKENGVEILDVSNDRLSVKSCDRESSNTKNEFRDTGYGESIENEIEIIDIKVTRTVENLHLTYKIAVITPHQRWHVYRRGVDFRRFIDRLKEEGEEFYFSEYQNCSDIEMVLKSIATSSDLMKGFTVRNFLHLDNFKKESRKDKEESHSSKGGSSDIVLTPSKLASNKRSRSPRKNELDFHRQRYRRTESDTRNGNYLENKRKRTSVNDFQFLTVIGKGSFGKVLLAKRKEDGKYFAIKIMNKRYIIRRNETAHILSERSVLLRMLRHPYIVQLHYAFTSRTKIFFVLDYISGGELFYHLQRVRYFSEGRARFYAAEICCALTYMHTKGIIYRDLKPENLLLDKEGHIVLTDFGLCKEGLKDSNSKTKTFCGTPEYLAPEVLMKRPYTRSVDWWTFGAVLYEMMFGVPPFYYRNRQHMFDAILNRPLRVKANVSAGAKDILSKLLSKNPSYRLGSGKRDGLEVMEHQFFDIINWKKAENRGLTPPYVPVVNSDHDTRNIDPIFTRAPVYSNSSVTEPSVDPDAFKEFCYVGPDECENVGR